MCGIKFLESSFYAQSDEIHTTCIVKIVGLRRKGRGEEEGARPHPRGLPRTSSLFGSATWKDRGMFTATSQTLICLLISRGIMCWKKAAILLQKNNKKVIL